MVPKLTSEGSFGLILLPCPEWSQNEPQKVLLELRSPRISLAFDATLEDEPPKLPIYLNINPTTI